MPYRLNLGVSHKSGVESESMSFHSNEPNFSDFDENMADFYEYYAAECKWYGTESGPSEQNMLGVFDEISVNSGQKCGNFEWLNPLEPNDQILRKLLISSNFQLLSSIAVML